VLPDPRLHALCYHAATPPPQDQASSPAKDAQRTQQPQHDAADSKSFCWTKTWWPVIPLHYLDAKKPMPVTMLGHTYVVWFDPKAESWRVMEDRCPHRLAPLSEGRIDADGTLMCS
jgi:pheophorbide a oxygenase